MLTTPVLIVGGAADCPDLEYASGFRAVDPVVCLKTGAKGWLVVPQLEQGRAEKTASTCTVLTPDALGLKGPRRGRLGYWALALLRKAGVKRVSVPAFFPLGVADRLRRAGIHVSVAEGPLFPERAVKRPDEIRNVREAQQAAVIATRAAVAMLAESRIDYSGCLVWRGRRLTSEAVRRAILKVLLDHNCFAREIIVAGGEQSVDPHQIGEGLLHAHETIVIDIFPQNLTHGYWGDITRTVVRGAATSTQRKMYHAVKAAQAAALNTIRAGVLCRRVHQAAAEEMERRGFKTETVDGRPTGFIHSTGHGVGLAIHEAPSLGMGDGRLKAGNVVTVEPGLYYPGLGGIRIEDTVVVTATGWQYLVPCEKKLEI